MARMQPLLSGQLAAAALFWCLCCMTQVAQSHDYYVTITKAWFQADANIANYHPDTEIKVYISGQYDNAFVGQTSTIRRNRYPHYNTLPFYGTVLDNVSPNTVLIFELFARAGRGKVTHGFAYSKTFEEMGALHQVGTLPGNSLRDRPGLPMRETIRTYDGYCPHGACEAIWIEFKLEFRLREHPGNETRRNSESVHRPHSPQGSRTLVPGNHVHSPTTRQQAGREYYAVEVLRGCVTGSGWDGNYGIKPDPLVQVDKYYGGTGPYYLGQTKEDVETHTPVWNQYFKIDDTENALSYLFLQFTFLDIDDTGNADAEDLIGIAQTPFLSYFLQKDVYNDTRLGTLQYIDFKDCTTQHYCQHSWIEYRIVVKSQNSRRQVSGSNPRRRPGQRVRGPRARRA